MASGSASEKAKAVIAENRRNTVERFVSMLGDRTLSWTREWHGCSASDPMNPCTGTHYGGGNRVNLMFAALDKKDNRFCTYKQAAQRGWQVRRGAKGHIVEKYSRINVYERDDGGEVERDGEGRPKIRFSYLAPVGWWHVFSFSDIEGAPPMPQPTAHGDSELDALLDALKETSRCRVDEGVPTNPSADSAYYSPARDFINLPDRTLFTSVEAALATLCHEMGHSTGHADACGRDGITGFSGFGSEAYAFEELVAELSSVFTTGYLGCACAMDGVHFRNHAAYLQSWLSVLEDDPDYLFKAATKAGEASDFVTARLCQEHPEYERADEIIPETGIPARRGAAPPAKEEQDGPDEPRAVMGLREAAADARASAAELGRAISPELQPPPAHQLM